jgi:prepilin-type N-terminal cleavage/methylation domain-containing protein
MNLQQRLHRTAAFTLPELLVIMAVILIMYVVVLPSLSDRRTDRGRIKCVNNLKNVSLAFRIFATDNNDQFPFELSSTNGGTRELHANGDPFAAFQVLSNELSTPKIAICPRDTRHEATNWTKFSNQNVSYFLNTNAAESNPNRLPCRRSQYQTQRPTNPNWPVRRPRWYFDHLRQTNARIPRQRLPRRRQRPAILQCPPHCPNQPHRLHPRRPMNLNRSNQCRTTRPANPRAHGTESPNNSFDWSFVVGKPIQQPNRSAPGRIRRIRLYAFTLIELLVVLAVGVIVFLIVLPPTTGGSKGKAERIHCVNNLKNLGLGFRIFATDNGDRYPWETNFVGGDRHLDDYLSCVLPLSSNIPTPSILHCPTDSRKSAKDWNNFARENASYFIGINAQETFPQSALAGDRNLTTNGVRIGPGKVELPMNSPALTNAAWDGTQHQHQGNAVMGDGSVQQLSSARLKDQLRNTGLETNVWLFP